MACQICFLFILTGFTGIESTTPVEVSQISVKNGSSISVPCRYVPRYRENVKYICQGRDWRDCTPVIKTNQKDSQKYSISDDKEQGIFNVTIKDLTHEDTEYYWCVIETKAKPYNMRYFHLSVTSDTPNLYVDNQFKASKGQIITIRCSHKDSGQTKWCRLGEYCVTKSSGSINGTNVTIKGFKSFFTVTMSGLKPENSGWYLCVRGDFQLPVHLTVTKEHVTTYTVKTILTDPEITTVPDIHQSTCQRWDTLHLRLIILIIVTPFVCFLFRRYQKRQEPVTPAVDGEGIANTVV